MSTRKKKHDSRRVKTVQVRPEAYDNLQKIKDIRGTGSITNTIYVLSRDALSSVK